MGGGGQIYDRDTKDGYTKTSGGFSTAAATEMSRSRIDAGLLPKNRRLTCTALSPVVFGFDVTGSMGNLPKIIYDKMPLIAGQIVECGYLRDAQMSLAAIGDVQSDSAPVQIGDFAKVRTLDDWLKRIWLEGKGGGNGGESYEYTAYFYAKYCDIPNATTPFFLITGDEDYRETLYESELAKHFGGKHKTTTAKKVIAELKKKFKGNVFLIHREYAQGDDARIVSHWEELLGEERVIRLGSDPAIADVTLGLFAIMSGSRTLDEYLDDMKTKRDKAQTEERIEEVRKSLEPITRLTPLTPPTSTAPATDADEDGDEDPPSAPPAKKKKPGRV